ncbi:unnamed protein product [Cladocopium goreaui]|uniref:E3 ubiquitin-protein ligase HERC1 n=1 Tax=Cladocopium goreaui TaxID=2562237 RepID=A0A9P1CTB7_9DINO|nr:unnamed protein product [Cladocopium goreaui]
MGSESPRRVLTNFSDYSGAPKWVLGPHPQWSPRKRDRFVEKQDSSPGPGRYSPSPKGQVKPSWGFGTGDRDWNHLPHDYWPKPMGASPDLYSKHAPAYPNFCNMLGRHHHSLTLRQCVDRFMTCQTSVKQRPRSFGRCHKAFNFDVPDTPGPGDIDVDVQHPGAPSWHGVPCCFTTMDRREGYPLDGEMNEMFLEDAEQMFEGDEARALDAVWNPVPSLMGLPRYLRRARMFGRGEDEPPVNLQICLPSGSNVKLSFTTGTLMIDVKDAAQEAFKVGFIRLVTPAGHFIRSHLTIEDAGLRDGDTLNAIVQPVQLSSNGSVFALWSNCGLVTWGIPYFGGLSSEVQDRLRSGEVRLQQLQNSQRAFCAVFEDGTAMAWGESTSGGDSSKVQPMLKDVLCVQASQNAFAAILANGRVETWGAPDFGGDSRAVKEQLQHVKQIQSSDDAFAALLEDGRVVSWGDRYFNERIAGLDITNIDKVQSSAGAFAGIDVSGSAVAWGDPEKGGDCTAVKDQLTNIVAIQGNDESFAALRADGTAIQAANYAFAAILEDGSVVSWGRPQYGGDQQKVADRLKNVTHIQATEGAFAAITGDGSVVSLGDPNSGGDSRIFDDLFVDVKKISASDAAFAALLGDGGVVTWGDPNQGGDSSTVQEQLWDVQDIQSTERAFAAVLASGTVVPWGMLTHGGASREIHQQLLHFM